MDNRVRFKIGEIEFEAEGNAEIIERERNEFLNRLLPAAVDAIERIHVVEKRIQYIDAQTSTNLLPDETNTTPFISEPMVTVPTTDLSRTNLSSFLKRYGTLTDTDFTLISAYFDEKKNGTPFFTSDSVKGYYAEARRSEYSNRSSLIYQLAKKGYIMDNPGAEGKLPKQYILTTEGMAYVEAYKPKAENIEKKNITLKSRKAVSGNSSIYGSLNLDEMNLKSYPVVKSLDSFKKQMLVVMYIITNEGKGEFFTIDDILHIMTNLWGLPATVDQVKGIFRREKTWFKQEIDPTNKKADRRKLLEGGKDFARSIIKSCPNEMTVNNDL